jgi:hypothetical protein
MDYGDSTGLGESPEEQGIVDLGILAGCSGNHNRRKTSRIRLRAASSRCSIKPRHILAGDDGLIIAGLICAGVILVAVFLVLGTLGQTGLIAGINHADEQGGVTLSQAWSLGLPLLAHARDDAAGRRGRLVLAVVAAAVFFFGTVLTLGIGLICLLPLICLLIPVAIFVGMYLKLVQNSIVVEKRPVFDSFGRAWQLVQANLGPVIVMASSSA